MTTSRTPKVVSVGEAMIEMAPVHDGHYRKSFAGDTFNTCWHLGRILGPQARVGYVSRVGQDGISDAFVKDLCADGIDATFVGRDPVRTMGLYLIELSGAERSFHYWRKDAAARLLADDPEWLDRAFDGSDIIHLSGITVAILAPKARDTLVAALVRARANGARVSFDPNIRPKLWSSVDEIRATLPAFLALTDIAVPSFDDEVAIWGDASPAETLARFANAGVPEVAVKNGAGQVALLSNGRHVDLDTPPVADIRDTTGAGDAFNAGYLAARVTGHDPVTAVAWGQAVSGRVIGHPGARLPRDLVPDLDGMRDMARAKPV